MLFFGRTYLMLTPPRKAYLVTLARTHLRAPSKSLTAASKSLGTAIMASMPVPARPDMVLSSASKIFTLLKPLSRSSRAIVLGGSRRVAIVPQFTPSPSANPTKITNAAQRISAAIAGLIKI